MLVKTEFMLKPLEAKNAADSTDNTHLQAELANGWSGKKIYNGYPRGEKTVASLSRNRPVEKHWLSEPKEQLTSSQGACCMKFESLTQT